MPTKIQAQDVDTATEFNFSELSLTDGSVSDPSLKFQSDPNTGLYRFGSDNIGFTAGGINMLQLTSDAVYPLKPVWAQDGSVSSPTYSFDNDNNTGIYRATTDQIAITAGGVQGMVISGGSIQLRHDTFYQRAATGAEALLKVTNSAVAGANTYGVVRAEHNNGTFSANAGLVANLDGSSVRRSDVVLNGVSALATQAQGGVAEQAMQINVYNTAQLTAMNIPKTAEVQFQLGSASLPSISFQGDPDTGIYGSGTNGLLFSTGGVQKFSIGTSTSIFSTNLNIAFGESASSPGIRFSGDDDTGIWRSSSDTMNFSTGGVNRWQIDSGGALVSANSGASRLSLGDGTVGSPSMQFSNDPDTGIYRPTTNTMAVTTGGAEKWRFLPAGGFRPVTYNTSFHDGGFGERVIQNQSTSVDYGIGGDFIGFVFVQTFNNVNTAHGSKLFWVASSATELSFTQLAAQGPQSGLITVTNPSGMTLRVALGATGTSNNGVMFMRINYEAG